jgi:exonuclease SbcC
VSLDRTLAGLRFLDPAAQQLQDAYKYWDALKALKQSISEYEASLMDKQKRLGSLEEKLAVLNGKRLALHELKEEIAQMAGQVSRLQVLSEAFGRDGIPHQIVRDIIPELEASANEILGQMTGGRMRLEFRTERTLKSNKAKEVATLDIVIIDVDHGELPYLSRSGGQKVRAALATNIALTRLKASRVGLQLGMMFIDEPPFLDAEGVESYCSALQVTHEMYPEMRVVSISHDENMKNAFPQQLYVEMTNNGSKVLKGR